MLVTLTQGKHLLIHGPASFTIQKGVVEILKALIHQSSKGFLVPKGRVLALKAIEDCLITINIGEGGKVEEREKAFPEQWDRVIDELSCQKGTVVVIGNVDSGKTTFCTMVHLPTGHCVSRAISRPSASAGPSHHKPVHQGDSSCSRSASVRQRRVQAHQERRRPRDAGAAGPGDATACRPAPRVSESRSRV